jgi:hypothetical protein
MIFKMNKHAQALGKIGGKIKSDKKAAASRENGKKGGRKRTVTGLLICTRKDIFALPIKPESK